jgi:hypothetical protein
MTALIGLRDAPKAKRGQTVCVRGSDRQPGNGEIGKADVAPGVENSLRV